MIKALVRVRDNVSRVMIKADIDMRTTNAKVRMFIYNSDMFISYGPLCFSLLIFL